MKNKTIKILCVFFVTIFLLSILPENAIATSITYPIDFEGYTPNLPYSDSFMTSYKRTGSQFNVSTINPNSGTRSFYAKGTGGWFNLTYSKTTFLTKIQWYWYRYNGNVGYNTYIGFYNKTIGHPTLFSTPTGIISERTKYIILLKIDTYAGYMYYVDDSGTSILIASAGLNQRKYFNITILNNIGDIDYCINSTIIHGISCYPPSIYNNTRIDSMYIFNHGTDYEYFDDMNFTISTSYIPSGEGEGYGCGIDFSPYTEKKTMVDDSTNFIEYTMTSKHYLETYYGDIKMTTRVWGVSLLIQINQYLNTNVLNDYELMINGMSIGAPDCFESYGNSYTWRLTWKISPLNVSITHDFIKLAFYCSHGWYIPCIVNPGINGFSYIRYHDSLVLYQNNVYDGTLLTYLGSTHLCLPIRIYYGQLTIIPSTSGFKDSIETSYNSYEQYHNVNMLYKINSTTSAGATNYIKIWKSGIEISYPNQHIPYTIPQASFSGQWTFTPMIGGIYKLCLYRNNANISTKTITVTNISDSNYMLWGNPNPHVSGTGYIIGYRYYNINGYPGIIAEYQGSNIYEMDFIKAGKTYVISNTSGNITVNAGIGDNIWIIYINPINLTYYEVTRMTEACFAQIDTKNTIDLWQTTNPHIIYPPNIDTPINIIGTHIYSIDFDVYVTLNEERIYPISGIGLDSPFSFWHNISKSNHYNASLWIHTSNGTTFLCSKEFDVMTEDESLKIAPSIFYIAPPYSYFVGTLFVILFTLSPLLLVTSIGKGIGKDFNLSSIPQFLYLVMATTGFVVCILFGWFPAWGIAILITMGALIAFIMWLRTRATIT